MKKTGAQIAVQTGAPQADPRRRLVLQGIAGLGGALALGACTTAAVSSNPRMTGGKITVRWLGGGVMELATPDYRQIAYADAWIWNNAGWSRFNVQKPPEYATKDGFVQYVVGKRPQAVLVLLSHDHGDHIGDYFEMLAALSAAGVPVMTTGQSDFMRKGLVPDFRKAGLDPAKIVANGGAAMNFGGVSKHGAMTAHLVPAVHSTLAGFPPAGFMLDIGGVRAYISGDTDLYGDLKMLGERYQPNLALVTVGNGPFTQGPEEAALACKWLGVSSAIPVHYAHNPAVRGVEAGEEFRRAMAAVAPGVQVIVMKPGETRTLAF